MRQHGLSSRSSRYTTAPGAIASTRIRDRSASDQRRRPTAPVITSSRRTSRGRSTISSSINTKRSDPGTVNVASYHRIQKVGTKHRLSSEHTRRQRAPTERGICKGARRP